MKLTLKTHSNLAIYFISFLCFTLVSAQEKPVYLIEDVQKKRTVVYVQNDTNSDKSVFLKIDPIGYRRSAQRPIIKNIPANSKVQMMILIPLTDMASSYTYNLIVNKELENIDVKRQKEKPKEIIFQNISKHNFYVYTKQNCKRCDMLIQKLKNKKIDFLEIDVNSKNDLLSPIFLKKLEDEGHTRENIELPFVKKNKTLYYPIPDFDSFIQEITKKS
ncbi:hypothetical protein [uncultured Aquimarina sp.]|uniref:hypothetical protein n=1 Tax=uncultured Aquimarina sp. TaxID=575652 RepID=UPI002639E619|nr:hypothetical protein [uncultured Aquimarina sp.]